MPTLFDDIYLQLFGASCPKEGEAFERIAAVVTSIVFPDADVAHNQKIRGEFSKSLYQVDVLRQESGTQVFGEAKDYTERGATGGKVGRGDLQKLGGALPDTGVDRATFYSATGYTREAVKYAAAADQMFGIPIDLIHIRPFVESDLDGRITKIVLNIRISIPSYDGATWQPVITPAGNIVLQDMLAQNGGETKAFDFKLDRFFDSTGVQKVTVSELTACKYDVDPTTNRAIGHFELLGHYIDIGGRLVEVSALNYSIPFLTETKTIEIEAKETPRILVKSEDGKLNKIVSEEQLRKVTFDQSGNVV